MKYAPGHFSAPVRAWTGLNRYEPQLHQMLKVNGNMGSAEMAMRARESREARLNSDDADTKFVARGTVTGMGLALFRDKPHANTVSRPKEPRPPRADTYQGRPCLYGHDGLRYSNGGKCVECDRARSMKRAAMLRQLLTESRKADQ
jgi:hypothetical protein